MNGLVALTSVLGAVGLLAACGSSGAAPEATGGAAGAGGTAASGGNAGTGGSPASGGTSGVDCPPVTPVIGTADGGAGGEDGTAASLCFPNLVCFSPAVATPGLPFVDFAFAFTPSSPTGAPAVNNESGVITATVSYPEPGRVCMAGDDGATLSLFLGSNPPWDGINVGAPQKPEATLHAAALGITAVSFTIETPPSTGVAPALITFPSGCVPAEARAERDGNPIVLTSSGTTTLFLATNFYNAIDTNAIGGLNFFVGQGDYDFCVSNLKFLDADGTELPP